MQREDANLILTDQERQLVDAVDSRDAVLEDECTIESIDERYNEYLLRGDDPDDAAELAFLDFVDGYEVEYSEEEKEAYKKHIRCRNIGYALGPLYEFD